MEQQSFTFKAAREKAAAQNEAQPLPQQEKKANGAKDAATPKIYTVTEIVRGARAILEGAYSSVWVAGEVSGYKLHSSGHIYFTLKDAASVLPAAIFRGSAQPPKFRVEDGLTLICHGRVSLYQRGGQYQLIVDYAEPKGVGALQLAFEQLKKKLKEEGLFDAARKRKIPFMPGKIGIVTSPTGAAIRDMLKVLRRRFPNIEILLAPAKVQGEGSAEEIAAQIELLNMRDDIDVMIVGRGGGSMEDLWAFNEERVARAIYASKIPVISAVGHEVDFTIADFVADFRAPTPSAAAEHAVPVKEELAQNLVRIKRQLAIELKRNVGNRLDRVADLRRRLVSPTRNFPEYNRYIDNLKERMIYSLQVVVSKRESSLKALEAELSHLSPLAVLAKGYSVVTTGPDKKAIRSSDDIKMGDTVCMRFSKGSAEGKVTRVVDR